MAKVLKVNVILAGKVYKAGTKESDLPDEVKKKASPFLIDEKKYKPAGKPGESLADAKIIARLSELEQQVEDEKRRANEAETALSEANSTIAGLTTEIENAQSRTTGAENNLEEAQEGLEVETKRADDLGSKLEEAKIIIDKLEKSAKSVPKEKQ
jgi:predicted  nucleic acid-binding Zn-ribbon protein